MQELKDKLKFMYEILLVRKDEINDLAQNLNKKREEYWQIRDAYNRTDRELAMKDGRYKVIPRGTSGIRKKEKSLSEQLKNMTEKQKRELLMQLMA